jgi:hypothetical protein
MLQSIASQSYGYQEASFYHLAAAMGHDEYGDLTINLKCLFLFPWWPREIVVRDFSLGLMRVLFV